MIDRQYLKVQAADDRRCARMRNRLAATPAYADHLATVVENRLRNAGRRLAVDDIMVYELAAIGLSKIEQDILEGKQHEAD